MHQIRKRLEEISSWNLSQGLVYHYTSPEGFQSIIEHQTLRFSRCDCLNDYKENEVVKEIYPSCLKELYDEGIIDQDHYEEYLTVSIEHGTGVYRTDETAGLTVSTPFVCCFSLDPDSLQMWQYYSKGGSYEGYNIGIDLCNLQEKTPIIRAGKVLYELNEKKKIIKEAISQIYKNDCIIDFDRTGKRYSLGLISSELAYLGCFMKRECFAGENEVRVVLEIPNNPADHIKENKLGFSGKMDMPTIEYRISHAMMIPYFDLPIKEIGTICNVTVGPITSHRDEAAKKNAEIINLFLLDKLGRQIEIRESKVPVRY